MAVPSPIILLLLVLLLSAAAWAVSNWQRRQLHRMLSKLARDRGMHYSARDRLTLTPRVATNLPIIGAAAVRVSDVLYRSGAAGHVYIFTAEYTAGVVRTKRRIRRVATFAESRDRTDRRPPHIELAPLDCDLVGQYRAVLDRLGIS